jgi:hypothetical protein
MSFALIPLDLAPETALQAPSRLDGVVLAAQELISFADEHPALAARAGVEVLALEARMALQGARPPAGRTHALGARDLATFERLDGIVALASSRMGECVAAMDREMSGRGIESIGRIIGLAGGAIGILKSIF